MKQMSPLSWETYEYEPRERSADWFWAVGIITVAIAITAIIFNNVLFGLVVIIGGFALSIFAARPPRLIDIDINDEGIRTDRHFYPYRTLESFWIDDQGKNPKILIKSQRLIMPYIIVHINVDEVGIDRIRRYLVRNLPEVFHGESVFEKIIERLGF